ncbi:PTS fructose transporter subunit IIABC [Halalkalibacterium halodurans]|jgi:PTS system fructose-specific IIC component|uniref:PTS fructose transporter subunit IIA n=1 Tax=Halalkalibacterium halodurans TaxID=86665 RepID=A0A0M0KC06_ALKHA|nr:PTS fructose transporter subunit IIABC [Halalkalibacterium halodurans]MED4164688.1 fructose-specific PTS transporter subunit EIIC [Halalkalibacterium halodurans]TPE70286.1 PTS fructose transporter subunit IIA [Halalkalibacterium halodurans]
MLKISELLKKDTMVLNLRAASKEAVIDELVRTLDKAGRLNDAQAFKRAILERESQSTTGVGEGIAIPHAKTAAVKQPAIAFGRSDAGIDYESLDGQPSHLFFMIAASEGANNEHLETLSRLSTFLMDESFRSTLMKAQSEDEILAAIDKKEAETAGEAEEKQEGYELLAVTGCPTGIAHTYMAADNLKSKAQELGVSIKVETNGSGGVKNRLTDEEISAAKAIIVAADTKVEMDRFHGKPVIQVPVTDGIRRPKELIDQALAGKAPVYEGGAQASGEDGSAGGGRPKLGFYKHLMNGVSNMLPFVVGGGILIAISFMFGIKAFDPSDPSYHPFAEMLMTIGGGNAFGLMIPVLAAFIAMSIADRPGFAAGMIGGLIASTGEAGFLGGLIAGFLAGYVALGVKKVLANLPQTLDGIKTILFYPVFNIFITGMIMLVIVGPLAAFNTGLQDWLGSMGTANMVILGIIIGGMMAVDMGGPINKAAFTFGIAMIDAGNFGPHAAVMAGGMVPPLGIALATTLFKKKFTKQEREAGKTNYILGASFITEGAIPFAAADPGRVIPSIIVGSAFAGGLTALFNVTLSAPHGGAFVIFIGNIVNNPLLYLVAIIAGSIVTALLLGFWKKDAKL